MWNMPNALTLLRICLVPVLIAALLDESSSGYRVAVAVFVLAAITDTLDGYYARSRNKVTRLGQVMDPAADKLVIVGALAALLVVDRVAAWIVVVVVARELAVSGLRLVAARNGAIIPASRLGKLKMDAQVVAVFVAIVADDPTAWWVSGAFMVAVVATVVSGADYFRNFRKRCTPVSEARTRYGVALEG
jgi:CDP-diacylglycerol--glycerol-3-phosphate 3-phosphatidyltransferase